MINLAGSDEAVAIFHFTNELAFQNITNAKKAAAEQPSAQEAVEAPADEPEVAESEESSAGV